MFFSFQSLVAIIIVFDDNNKILQPMTCEIAFLEMEHQYPFLQTRQNSSHGSIVQVRKSVRFDFEPRFILKEKARVLKSLGFQNLVGLESSKSDEDSLILYFQYVPFQFIGEISKLDEQKINKVYLGMLELCNSLASRYIIHQLDVRRVGLNKNYAVKYYLGIDFKVDRAIDKQKNLESYHNIVKNFFSQSKNGFQSSKDIKEEIKISEKRLSYKFLGLSPKNQIKNQPQSKSGFGIEDSQRKILKKSSILQNDHKNDELLAIKTPNRFTFNNDNCINLSIHEHEEILIEKGKSQPLKIEQLTARINRLKNYMKQVTSKTGSKNSSSNTKDNQATAKTSKYRFLSPTFAKFQKRITQLRESKMALAKKAQQNICKKGSESTNAQGCSSQIQTLSSSEGHCKADCNELHTQQIVKKNPINTFEDDRKHQQYLMLANKDKYCEQFMLFLQDNQSSLQCSLNKKQDDFDNITHLNQNVEEQLKRIHLRENLKTQSSQNALQIQNRVQKVIRSSLRIINELKSRQAVRCE